MEHHGWNLIALVE